MKVAVISLNRRGILGRQVTSPKTWHRPFGPPAPLINISEICPSRAEAKQKGGGGENDEDGGIEDGPFGPRHLHFHDLAPHAVPPVRHPAVRSDLPSTSFSLIVKIKPHCPVWYTMVHADGSVFQTFEYLKQHGLQGLKDIWPAPSPIAWKLIACFGAFEAIIQLALPGKRVEGPISPNGNIPVYKVCLGIIYLENHISTCNANGLQAYAVTLVTYLSLWWFGIFNPVIVYDHLGEIYSALVMGSLVFCLLLYLKGHVAPSSSDSGSSGNFIIDFYWGMELYPRIGKHFDIKVFTNCRFGMMSWAVLAVTYCIKQVSLL
ncbi:hypothetical protein BHE74_00003657 [Ensete ventricosum]|nr:hypothetical protein BHE74_00003657 [Ensete ventricosum]